MSTKDADLICKPIQYNLLSANLHGLPALPDELLLEILSHFPPDSVFVDARTSQIIRRETLHSLSAVCRNLRRIFRPYLWQRVEVYAGMQVGEHGPGKSSKHFAKELLRQLDVVTIQDPGLAQYVRIVDVEVNGSKFRPVLIKLGQCFSLFPNLHTVKIITKSNAKISIKIAKRAFKKSVSYPQIRSAILSRPIFPLLAACPNLESLTTFGGSRYLYMNWWSLPVLLWQVSNIPTVFNEEISSLQKLTMNIAYSSLIFVSARDLLEIIPFFPNLRTLDFRISRYRLDLYPKCTELLNRFQIDLPSRNRQSLKEVIVSADDEVQEVLYLSEC